VNLILAMIWLVVAVGAFVLSWAAPHLPFLWLAGSDLHIGAIALAFCAYNLVIWLIARQDARRQRMRAQRAARPRRPGRTRVEDSEPNPAFDFSDRPPAREERTGR
jgi:hypothetical protein